MQKNDSGTLGVYRVLRFFLIIYLRAKHIYGLLLRLYFSLQMVILLRSQIFHIIDRKIIKGYKTWFISWWSNGQVNV